MNYLHSLPELHSVMQIAAEAATEVARVDMLSDYTVRAAELIPPTHNDPFGSAYRDCIVEIHSKVSKRSNYQPDRDELIPFEPAVRALRPGIYTGGGSHFLGMYLEAIGQILQVADTQAGARVIEYGPGDGQIALAFARNGCDVAVVDIEARYLEAIRMQAAAIGVAIDARLGEFKQDLGLRGFDLAIFFEAFHHALDHVAVLDNLHDVLKPEGRIIFAGEPIIERGSYWQDVVPFPWGLRLDALSLSAVMTHGWMELGFQEGYFVELLMRRGWLVEKRVSPSNGRGTCYIATRMQGCVDLSENFLLDTWDEDAGWHGAQPGGRWTKLKALFPLPENVKNVRVSLFNPLPIPLTFTIGPNQRSEQIAAGQRVHLDVFGCQERLIINANMTDLAALTLGKDTRTVGVLVEKISFL